MKRFIEGADRSQSTLFPESLDDYVAEDNPVRVVYVFVDELDLLGLGFYRVAPRATGRPGYHPSVLLKLYIYGYLNQVQSSRRLEREFASLICMSSQIRLSQLKIRPSETHQPTNRKSTRPNPQEPQAGSFKSFFYTWRNSGIGHFSPYCSDDRYHPV